MRLRPALLLAAVLLALPASALAKGTVSHVRVAIDSNAGFASYPQTAQRHGVVILQAWQQDRLRALKEANPGVKVLVYKNLGFINEGTSWSGLSSSGVAYKEADSGHPEWFLENRSGARFTSYSHSYLWAADVGNASYQQRWADGVLAELTEHGWDGVFIDDANATMKYQYDVSEVAKYPSDSSYAAAVRSALATIGPRLRAAGKLAVANIGSWGEFPSVGNDWIQFLDGAMDEMFLKWGTTAGQGYASTARWEAQLAALRHAEAAGKLFLAVTHSANGDAAAARYGYATMLLGSEGRGHFALAGDYTNETWFPEYDYDLGAPTGPAGATAGGVHRRAFERGLVVVNPTGEPRQVSFGGTYSGSGLTSATGAALSPFSALVLTSEGGQAVPPPPAVPPRPPINVVAAPKAPKRVVLRWRGGGPGVRYLVKRNGRKLAIVRRRGFLDRRARPGRSQRYRIIAIGRHRRVASRSRVMRIRTPLRARRVVRRRALLAAALAPKRGRWTRAYVERRVRRAGRPGWRRVTRPRRPRAAMRFRLRLHRPAAVRLVLESTATGNTQHSGIVRTGG